MSTKEKRPSKNVPLEEDLEKKSFSFTKSFVVVILLAVIVHYLYNVYDPKSNETSINNTSSTYHFLKLNNSIKIDIRVWDGNYVAKEVNHLVITLT